MRQIATLVLPFLAVLPQPAAAQVLPYDFDFAEADPAPDGAALEGAVAEDAARNDSAPDEGDALPGDAGDELAVALGEPDYAAPAPRPRGHVHGEDGEADALAATTEEESAEPGEAERFVAATAPRLLRRGGAAYGPFRILDASHAAMVGVSDSRTPSAFAAMLRDHPGVATLEMVDCPGTEDDGANLRLGRMIRAEGIATHVPAGGWVASGAVELFLAGSKRSLAPSARFAVHSWEDQSGRGPADYSPNSPQNRAYLDYYRTMGMSDGEARSFYAMTNSAPFSRPRYLDAHDMQRYARLDAPVAAPQAAPLPAPYRAATRRGRFADYAPVSAIGWDRQVSF